MFNDVTVIGAGRAGATIAARLRERGIAVRADGELRLLCVPDSRDRRGGERDRARTLGRARLGRRHRSPRSRRTRLRFSVHPLQTLTLSRGPEQLDGALGAITAETADGLARARWLAETLGLQPVRARRRPARALPRGRAIASNFLVTLYRAAAELFERADAPPAALIPLMERTIENGFELTGPIARGDWETVDRHLAALHGDELEPLYRALAEATRP